MAQKRSAITLEALSHCHKQIMRCTSCLIKTTNCDEYRKPWIYKKLDYIQTECFRWQFQQNMKFPCCLKHTGTSALTGTHCSCISWVGAGTSKVVDVLVTFCQVTLCPCTIHIVIPGGTTSSSKESRPGSFNCYRIAQLMTDHCSISKVPVVITYSSPLAKEKDLNTTFQQSIPSHQSYRAFHSCVIWCYIYV